MRPSNGFPSSSVWKISTLPKPQQYQAEFLGRVKFLPFVAAGQLFFQRTISDVPVTYQIIEIIFGRGLARSYCKFSIEAKSRTYAPNAQAEDPFRETDKTESVLTLLGEHRRPQKIPSNLLLPAFDGAQRHYRITTASDRQGTVFAFQPSDMTARSDSEDCDDYD